MEYKYAHKMVNFWAVVECEIGQKEIGFYRLPAVVERQGEKNP